MTIREAIDEQRRRGSRGFVADAYNGALDDALRVFEAWLREHDAQTPAHREAVAFQRGVEAERERARQRIEAKRQRTYHKDGHNATFNKGLDAALEALGGGPRPDDSPFQEPMKRDE